LLIGKVDIHEPAVHLLLNRFDQRTIFQRKNMGVENTRVRFADGGGHLVADGLDLLPRLEQRGLKAR
jgi:hypothetical protein